MDDSPQQLARERRILAWMCVLIAANQLGFGSIIPVLPLYAQSFGVSASAVGLVSIVAGLGVAVLPWRASESADARDAFGAAARLPGAILDTALAPSPTPAPAISR